MRPEALVSSRALLTADRLQTAGSRGAELGPEPTVRYAPQHRLARRTFSLHGEGRK